MPKRSTPPAILRLADLEDYICLGRSAIYKLLQEDEQFPRQIRLTARAVGWRRADIDRWLESREVVDRNSAQAAGSV